MKSKYLRSPAVTIPSLGVVAFSLSACKWISSDGDRASGEPISTKILYSKKETKDFLDDVGDFKNLPAMDLASGATRDNPPVASKVYNGEIARLLKQAKAEVEQFGPGDVAAPEGKQGGAAGVTPSKVEALRTISRYEFLTQQGDQKDSVTRARALIVAGISDVAEQVRELTTLARDQHAYGDTDGAKETMRIARERSRSANEQEMGEVYAMLVTGYTAVGDTASGREFAKMIKDSSRQAEVLTDVAEAAAGRGDSSVVKELEDSIPNGEGKDWTLFRMVNAQLRGGDFAAAETSASQIDPSSEARVWSHLALAEDAAGSGEPGRFDELVTKIEGMIPAGEAGAADEDDGQFGKQVLRIRALEALSAIQTSNGQSDASSKSLKKAVATTRSIPAKALRDSLLLFLVRAYVDNGDLSGAHGALPAAANATQRIQGLSEIARAAHRSADTAGYGNAVAEMKELASGIEGVLHEDVAFALSQIALTQIEAGDFSGAERTTSKSIPGHWKDKALLEMTRAHANQGDVVEARRFARKITTSHPASLAMQEVARTQLRRGDIDGAEVSANGIEKIGLRAAMLAEVAENRSLEGAADSGLLSVAQGELPPFKRTNAVARLGRGQLNSGAIKQAVASVNELEASRDRCYGYLAIADALMNG